MKNNMHDSNCNNPSCSKCMKPKGIEKFTITPTEAATLSNEVAIKWKINEIIDFLNTVEAETKFGCYAENPSLNKMARELLQEKPAPEKEEKEDEPTKEEMEETQRNWDDMVSGKDY